MMLPGKYDAACTAARLETKAAAVLLIVIEGERGSGFSVQGPADLVVALPEILESTARRIRASLVEAEGHV